MNRFIKWALTVLGIVVFGFFALVASAIKLGAIQKRVPDTGSITVVAQVTSLRHRLLLIYEAQTEGIAPDAIVAAVIKEVKVSKE